MTPLARLMDTRGQTAEEVATATGLNPQTVRQLRDGARPPRQQTAARIAAAVGVAPSDLFPEAAADQQTPLAAELARRQISVRAVARAAGVHENSVYGWAAGKATPTAEKAVRLAHTLGVPTAQLFPPTLTTPHRPASTPQAPGAPPSHPPPASVRPSRPASAEQARAFARRVREVMAARRLSAGRVAAQAGVSRETISRWISGATSPQRDAAEKVAAALGLRLQPWTPASRTASTSLGAALVERGWTTQRLADITGVDPSTAQGWIAGRNRPSLANAQRLADALERPLTDLFDLAPDAGHTADPARTPEDRPNVPTPPEVLARPATGRAEWRDDAACATDPDPDRWWPTSGDLALDARATCGGCPVLGDCRDSFLAQPDRPDDRDGIWAGLPGHQLRAAARTQRRHATPTAGDQPRLSPTRATAAGSRGRHDRGPSTARDPSEDHSDLARSQGQRRSTPFRHADPVRGLAM